MKKFITISIIIFAISITTQSETIVKYDFGPAYNQTTLAPAIVANNITAGNFDKQVDGGTAYFGTGSNGTGNCWYVSGGWDGSTYQDYFYFTITIAQGWKLDVNDVRFDSKTSTSYGPYTVKVSNFDPEHIIQTDMDIAASGWRLNNRARTSPPTGLTGTVTFRIYAKDATHATYGNFYIDNVIVNGILTALPQPQEPTENIDPANTENQYAYAENSGWVNFEPDTNDAGAIISRQKVEGFIWAQNIGWINLFPDNYGGVYNDGMGHLSGYAWGENIGWINFNPNFGGVTIDRNGNFAGWAWAENIGWINFNNDQLSGQGVMVCVVNYMDLKTLAQQWLSTGTGLTADLQPDGKIDFKDFAVLATYWLDYCQSNWPL